MSEPTVEAYGLRKAFGGVQALDGLSLAVPAGICARAARAERVGQDHHRVHPGHLAASRRRPRDRRRAGRGDTRRRGCAALSAWRASSRPWIPT